MTVMGDQMEDQPAVAAAVTEALDAWHAACHAELSNWQAMRAVVAAVWPVIAAAVRAETSDDKIGSARLVALTEAADAITEYARMRISELIPVSVEWVDFHDGMHFAAGLVRGLAAKETKK